jgi:hypothetical protein
MENPEIWKFLSSAPVPVQILFACMFATVLAVTVGKAYFKTLHAPEPPADPRNLLLAAGTIADMGPVREVAAHTRTAADILAEIRDLMEAEFKERKEREEREQLVRTERLQRINEDLTRRLEEMERRRYTPS